MNLNIKLFSVIALNFFFLGFLCSQSKEELIQREHKRLVEKYQGEFLDRIQKSQTSNSYESVNQNQIIDFRNGNHQEIKLTDNSSPGSDEGEPTIAVNPNDPDNIVVSFSSFEIGGIDFNGVPVFFSKDGGLSWQFTPIPTDLWFQEDNQDLGLLAATGADYVLEFDNNGRLYFVCLQPGLSLNSLTDLYVATYWGWSDDGGESFQAASEKEDRLLGMGRLIMDGPGMISDVQGRFIDRPWLTVDNSGGANDGTVYIQGLVTTTDNDPLFNDNIFLGSAMYYKTPQMTGFDVNPTDLGVFAELDTFSQTQHANIYVDQNGTLHSMFVNIEDNTFSQGNVHHIVSEDGGQSFISLDPNLSYTYDGFPIAHDRESPMPDGVSSPNSDFVHMVYGERTGGVGLVGRYARSSDNGATWESPIDINDLLGITDGISQILQPTIAVDASSGRITLSFMGQDGSSGWDYYITSSLDNGDTWEPLCKLSAASTIFANDISFYGDYWETKVVNDISYCIWSDGREGNGPKVYIAIVDHNSSVNVSEVTPITDILNIERISPNPASTYTKLVLNSTKNMDVSIALLSIDGRLVQNFGTKNLRQGSQNFELDIPSNVTNGTYLLKIETSVGIFTRKIVVNK